MSWVTTIELYDVQYFGFLASNLPNMAWLSPWLLPPQIAPAPYKSRLVAASDHCCTDEEVLEQVAKDGTMN